MSDLIKPSLVNNIKEIIASARDRAYQAVNFAMVEAYWEIGKTIVEDEQQGAQRADYGKAVLEELSAQLTGELGKGFSVRNLRNMRSFYHAFPIRQTVSAELSWSHYCLLIRIDSEQKRTWYMKEAGENNWSVRQMERQINAFYFERLLASQNKKPVKEEAQNKLGELEPENFIRDPYVLEFLDLPEKSEYNESDLEQALINNLQSFLLELGKGFSFVARQMRVSTETSHFYLDLVFYNYLLKCFVLIDLKIGQLSHQDIGQVDMYVRMFDDLKRGPTDNPTIGLILCANKDETVVKYSVLKDNKQLFASEYSTVLPTEKELEQYLTRTMIEAKS